MKVKDKSMLRICVGNFFTLKTDLVRHIMHEDADIGVFTGARDRWGQLEFHMIGYMKDDVIYPVKQPRFFHRNALLGCKGTMLSPKEVPDELKAVSEKIKFTHDISKCRKFVRATMRLDPLRDERYTDVLRLPQDSGEDLLFYPISVGGADILYGWIVEPCPIKIFRKVRTARFEMIGSYEDIRLFELRILDF